MPVNIPYGSGFLRAKQGFVLSLWREEGLYCADDTCGLGISEAARTYEELRGSINDTLEFLWEEYALAADSDLNDGAGNLKRSMLEHFSVSEA